MTADVPAYVLTVFILTGLLTVGIFLFAIARAGMDSWPARFLAGFVIVWAVIQAIAGSYGFFQRFDTVPPRTFAFGPLPFFALTIVYLIFFRKFLNELPLATLTLLHVIRIPIEFCLLWLFESGQVPVEMTFEGRNFDILSGLTAPIVYFLAFRKGTVNRWLLLVWNIIALGLLTNIVTIAVLAFPSPFQTIGLDQPNVGVTVFPFVWLPSVIVPIVFFAHVTSIWRLSSNRDEDLR